MNQTNVCEIAEILAKRPFEPEPTALILGRMPLKILKYAFVFPYRKRQKMLW